MPRCFGISSVQILPRTKEKTQHIYPVYIILVTLDQQGMCLLDILEEQF